MKKIISYLYSGLLVIVLLYLWYAKVNWTINYDYIRSLDIIFLFILLLIIISIIACIIGSTASKKKRYIIWLCILLLCAADIWLMDTLQFYGSDFTKLVSVLWIFLALFGSFSEKKQLIKGEYTKKVEIIEA